jgi:hypothetical protein
MILPASCMHTSLSGTQGPKVTAIGITGWDGCDVRIDGWRVVDEDYGQAVGKLQAESMMSTAASLFPQ